MSMTKINWYPGHMKKTKDMMRENMQIIDVVLEIVDARIPISSQNPDIAKFAKNKKRIIVLNKSDLVEKSDIEFWKNYFIENNLADKVLDISAETGYNIKKLFSVIEEVSKDKKEKMLKKGLRKVNIRLMVAGIPNVGKSRLINRIVGKKSAGVGNMPGFTKGKQWVRIKEGLELLDTPGILWPKFEDEEVGYSLGITGAIKDDILPIEEVAAKFIERLMDMNRVQILKDKYKLLEEDFDSGNPEIILSMIGKRMGMILKGDRINIKQASLTLLRDYRNKKLGKFGVDRGFVNKIDS